MNPEEIARNMDGDDDDLDVASLMNKAVQGSGLKAVKKGDKVFLNLNGVEPEALRRLADALEDLGIPTMQAVASYQNPRRV